MHGSRTGVAPARRRSPLRTLRSRILAVWLLAGIAAWSAVGAGFEEAFSSPVFMVLIGILSLSTTFCAWERTRTAWSQWQRTGAATESLAKRLRDRPAVVIAVSGEAALTDAAEALRAARLCVRQEPRLIEATGGRWGLFGSPLFHWSLALLIVVVALGQLTRAEGFIGVPEGESRVDEAAAYGLLKEGPLYFGHSGLDISVSDLRVGYMVDDIDRGAAPIVTLTRSGENVAEQRVYPNNPLRYGRLLIHMEAYGFAPVLVLADGSGTEIVRETFLVDFDDSLPGGLTVTGLKLPDAGGTIDRYRGRLTLSLPEEGESTGRVVFELYEHDKLVLTRDVRRGEPVELPNGERLVLESIGLYASLSIADDWSVPFIYALLVLASLGISVAVLSPYRKAWVMLVEDDNGGGFQLHIAAKHWRGSPTFGDDVIAAVEAAVEPDEGIDDDS